MSSTVRTGNGAARNSQLIPTSAKASTTSPTRKPAIAFNRRGLSHIGALQDPYAELFVADAHRARGHRHERMVGHPRSRIDLEQVGLAAPIEHEIDASPAAAAERLECLEAQGQDLDLFRLGNAAGNEIARVVG